jgi:hypothetical protein
MIVNNHSREFIHRLNQLAAKPCKPLYKFTDISKSTMYPDHRPCPHEKARILSNAGLAAEGARGRLRVPPQKWWRMPSAKVLKSAPSVPVAYRALALLSTLV